MKEYEFNKNKYELNKEKKDLFDYEKVKDLFTSYFDNFDYVLGDESYNKLRLKGFCDKKNKNYKKINSIENLDNYIENYCAYNCRYFLLKKIK